VSNYNGTPTRNHQGAPLAAARTNLRHPAAVPPPMWDIIWYRLHINIHMKTIQMTIDERLLRLVDKLSRARKTTRSAFIRDALEAEIRRQKIREEEARHIEGYARKPVTPGEFDVWIDEQDWGAA
jgi:predicted transcriptional regulator